MVIVGGELAGGREIRDKLQAYAEGGGHLVLTSANLARLPGGLAGRTAVTTDAVLSVGSGRLTLFASPFGIEPDPAAVPPRSEIDRHLPKPYRLEAKVPAALQAILEGQRLFTAGGDGLSLITCRRGTGDYVVGIANNTWRPQPFAIRSRCGPLVSLRELPLDTSEQGAPGHLPEGVDGSAVGRNDDRTIAGGHVRIFAVRVTETGVREIPHERPAPRPKGRLLPLRRLTSLREAILARPTFFEHWDGVVVDWRYLHERERSALTAESTWLRRQELRIVVDLASGVNLYPTLRLIDNLPADYAASREAVRDVLAKMGIIGARDLVLSLHRHPENNFTEEQTRAAFESTLKDLAREAEAAGVTLHLRLTFGKPPWDLGQGLAWLDRVASPRLKLAPATALLASQRPTEELTRRLAGRVGLWFAAAARQDLAGRVWDAHAPLSGASQADAAAAWVNLAPDVPVVADTVLPDADAEYLEAVALGAIRR